MNLTTKKLAVNNKTVYTQEVIICVNIDVSMLSRYKQLYDNTTDSVCSELTNCHCIDQLLVARMPAVNTLNLYVAYMPQRTHRDTHLIQLAS